MKSFSTKETAVLIRKALKVGFPNTTFSVRTTRSTHSFNVDVRWTDGPTTKQVDEILNRFKSKCFDSMQDMESYCGERMLNGERVTMGGNYVSGSRECSRQVRELVAKKLADECDIEVTLGQYDNVSPDALVKKAWHQFWVGKTWTLEEFQAEKYILVNDSQGHGEWFSTLMHRVLGNISMEAQQPIPKALLPEYIEDAKKAS
jgi:hypothetical protein